MEQFERKRCGSGGVVDGVGGNRRALGQQIGQPVRNRCGWGEKWSGIGAVGDGSGAESEGSGIDEEGFGTQVQIRSGSGEKWCGTGAL